METNQEYLRPLSVLKTVNRSSPFCFSFATTRIPKSKHDKTSIQRFGDSPRYLVKRRFATFCTRRSDTSSAGRTTSEIASASSAEAILFGKLSWLFQVRVNRRPLYTTRPSNRGGAVTIFVQLDDFDLCRPITMPAIAAFYISAFGLGCRYTGGLPFFDRLQLHFAHGSFYRTHPDECFLSSFNCLQGNLFAFKSLVLTIFTKTPIVGLRMDIWLTSLFQYNGIFTPTMSVYSLLNCGGQCCEHIKRPT